jgi:hypothetical protein
MAKVRIKHDASNVNAANGVGVTRAEVGTRQMLVYGYSIGFEGANLAADMKVAVYGGYSGLSSELLSFTGTESLAAATYESDFTADADSWVELTDGDATFAGNIDVGGKTDCLRITADAGGDPSSLQRPATVTSGKYYKVTCSVRCDAAAALNGSFVGLGENGDAWFEQFDHDAGEHPEIVAVNTWYDITMYGKADTTALQITVFTGKNNQTEDAIGANGILYFHDIKVYEVQNHADWVESASAEFGYNGYDQGFSCDAGAGGTATWTSPTGINSTELFRCSALIDDWVAATGSMNTFGSYAQAFGADGTYTWDAESDGTDTVILTADGTGDMDMEALSVKRIQGVDTSAPLYNHYLRSGRSTLAMITFPQPIYMADGWYFYLGPGGTDCITHLNVFYQIQ